MVLSSEGLGAMLGEEKRQRAVSENASKKLVHLRMCGNTNLNSSDVGVVVYENQAKGQHGVVQR